MAVEHAPARPAASDEPARLQRLLPAGGTLSAAELVAELGLWERPAAGAGPPRVLLNMVSAVDGRATLQGRSAPLSSPADRELFHALRAPVDAVLVGAGTIRVERYGRLIRDPSVRARRREHGLPEEPLACVVTGTLDLDPTIPLLSEPQSRLVVITASPRELGDVACSVEYVRAMRDGRLDLGAALEQLAARFDVRTVLSEGGPHLAGELVAADLLDELFLSVSPQLAGGEQPGAEAMRILAGRELDPPARLHLRGALAHESHLFLRYAVEARERVSRATALSSSEAS